MEPMLADRPLVGAEGFALCCADGRSHPLPLGGFFRTTPTHEACCLMPLRSTRSVLNRWKGLAPASVAGDDIAAR